MWIIESLEDACAFISRGISPKYIKEGGVLVLNQKCVRNHSIDYSFARRHDIHNYNVKPERFIKKGDVLINSTGQGTLGRVAQVREQPPEPTTVDSHVTIVRPKVEKFYLDFFGYVLIRLEGELKQSGQGTSGQTELAKSRIQKEFFASYPRSQSEQHRIVAKLDAAFAEIDRAVETTEEQIRQNHQLFASVVESRFKQRVGWQKKTLQDVCEKITDGTHQTPRYFDDGYIFLSSKNVTTRKIDWDNIKYIDEEQHIAMQKRLSPRVGDILLAKNGTTGVAAMVDRIVEFDIYVSLALLRSKGEVTPKYLLQFINSSAAKTQFSKRTKGIGVPNLHLKEIREVEISFPPDVSEQNSVTKIIDEIDSLYQHRNTALEEKEQSLHLLKSAILAQELTPPKTEAA